jgi:DNA-binding LacI/PurR family transcriptional regulator
MRLRPERELSRRLSLDRRRLRAILDRFVETGVLTRTQGSGTFVRKVPFRQPSSEFSQDEIRELQSILFVDPFDYLSAERTGGKLRQLRIGVIADFEPTNLVHQLVLSGIAQALEENENEMNLCSIPHLLDHRDPEGELSVQLGKVDCDGYIVLSKLAELFTRILPASEIPVAYLWPGSAPFFCQPLVDFDSDGAMEVAFSRIRERGFRRISVVEFSEDREYDRLFRKRFARLLEDAPNCSGEVDIVDRISNGIAETLEKRLRGSERPDAIYVADDHLLPDVKAAIEDCGFRLGADVGVVTLANVGLPLVEGVSWTRLEFNPHLLGRSVVEALLRVIRTAGEEISSLSYHATWREGETLPARLTGRTRKRNRI